MTSQLPPVPPGPADTTHPRRALARLALASSYWEAADFAAGGVPTVSDEFGDAYDDASTGCGCKKKQTRGLSPTFSGRTVTPESSTSSATSRRSLT